MFQFLSEFDSSGGFVELWIWYLKFLHFQSTSSSFNLCFLGPPSRSIIFLFVLNLSRSLITRLCCDKVSSCRRWHSSGKLPSTQPSAQFIILAFWWCLMWMILKAIYLHNSHFNLLDCADPALTFASTVALPVAASNPAVAISKQRRFNELSSALLELNLIWCTGSPLRAFHPSVTRTSSLIIATSLIKPPTAFA